MLGFAFLSQSLELVVKNVMQFTKDRAALVQKVGGVRIFGKGMRMEPS